MLETGDEDGIAVGLKINAPRNCDKLCCKYWANNHYNEITGGSCSQSNNCLCIGIHCLAT